MNWLFQNNLRDSQSVAYKIVTRWRPKFHTLTEHMHSVHIRRERTRECRFTVTQSFKKIISPRRSRIMCIYRKLGRPPYSILQSTQHAAIQHKRRNGVNSHLGYWRYICTLDNLLILMVNSPGRATFAGSVDLLHILHRQIRGCSV